MRQAISLVALVLALLVGAHVPFANLSDDTEDGGLTRDGQVHAGDTPEVLPEVDADEETQGGPGKVTVVKP